MGTYSQDPVEDAVAIAMIEHGPDGHIDGYAEIAQAVIDALGLHHVEGTDGEWRVVSAWQDTSRPF